MVQYAGVVEIMPKTVQVLDLQDQRLRDFTITVLKAHLVVKEMDRALMLPSTMASIAVFSHAMLKSFNNLNNQPLILVVVEKMLRIKKLLENSYQSQEVLLNSLQEFV